MKGVINITDYKKIRVLLILIPMLILQITNAQADKTIFLQPDSSDLKENELREIASDFFSVKWGIPKEDIFNAEMLIRLMDFGGPDKRDPHLLQEYGGELPQWQITVYPCPGNGDHSVGTIGISRTGTILWWEIFSPWPYYDNEPDLMSLGTMIIPTDADATPQEIYEHTMEHLRRDFYVENPEQYTYKIAFLKDEHFYQGFPVWIVYVQNAEELLWKGVFGYTGLFMTLVQAQQEYREYYVHEYVFSVYAANLLGYSSGIQIDNKVFRAQRGFAGKEEILEIINELIPVYNEWKLSYPRGDRIMEDFINEFEWMFEYN